MRYYRIRTYVGLKYREYFIPEYRKSCWGHWEKLLDAEERYSLHDSEAEARDTIARHKSRPVERIIPVD